MLMWGPEFKPQYPKKRALFVVGWWSDSSGRAPALQLWGPEFKPKQNQKKKKKKKEKSEHRKTC
jgi:hypothetical protein